MKFKILICSGVITLSAMGACFITQTAHGISPDVQLSSIAAVIAGADNRGVLHTNEIKQASLGKYADALYSYSPNVSTEYAVSAGNAQVTVRDAKNGEKINVNENGHYVLEKDAQYIIIAQGRGEKTDTSVSVIKQTAPVLEGVGSEISLDEEARLSIGEKEEVSELAYVSSNEEVLTVDEEGNLSAVGPGVAVLSVTGVDSDNIPFVAETEVAVTAPEVPDDMELVVANNDEEQTDTGSDAGEEQAGPLAFGGADAIPVSNLAEGSEISAETSDDSLKAEVEYDGGTTADIRLTAEKEGNFEVYVTINGRKYPSSVSITSGTLSPVMTDLETGEEITFSDEIENMYKAYDTTLITTDSVITLDAEGFTDTEQIRWSTDDEDVASFDEEGRLHITGAGEVKVTASYNGAFASCRFTCVQKQVIGALEYVRSKYGSTYSQENRMGATSFDCSSLVWRAYASQGVYIGGWTSWAPVASAEASYLVGQKCLTFEAGSPTSQLRPGDLVFWTGRNAGEYLGIYHVDMYMGNGLCMTVRTSSYLGSTLPSNCFVVRPMATAQDDAASLKAENSYYRDPEDTGTEPSEGTTGENSGEDTGSTATGNASVEEAGKDTEDGENSGMDGDSQDKKKTDRTSSGDDLSSDPEEETGSENNSGDTDGKSAAEDDPALPETGSDENGSTEKQQEAGNAAEGGDPAAAGLSLQSVWKTLW